MSYVCWEKLGKWFTIWKETTFRHLADEKERKRAKAIEKLVFNNMSPVKFMFWKWTREMFNGKTKEVAERMKAWFILNTYAKKHREKEIKSLENWAF